MNKNRGIWLVIAAILIIGIAVTFTTSRFIKQNGGSLDTAAVPQMTGTTAGGAVPQLFSEAGAQETPAQAAARGRMSAAPSQPEKEEAKTGEETKEALLAAPKAAAYDANTADGALADGGTAPESEINKEEAAAAEAAPALADEAGPGSSSALVPAISPLEPAGGAAQGSSQEEKEVYYEKRLAELDVQVQKMRSEASDSTTYSMKTLAEKELTLWNMEMNVLYSEIADVLTEEAKSKLESDQQAWLKTRDTRAEEAARKYSGGSLEGVEYTASLAESTRERTYNLVEEYSSVLPAE